MDRLNRKDKEMKFMIPFLMAAVLPAAALAQSQAGTQSPSGAQTQPAGGSGVPSIAIPKTTEVIVIETPKQGVTPQQVTAVIPEEIKASFTRRENPPVAFARRWQRCCFRGRRENRGRGTSDYGNAAAREGAFDGSPIHSRRTVDAAEGTEPRGVSVSHVSTAVLCEVSA
jgi:hypothetical protein